MNEKKIGIDITNFPDNGLQRKTKKSTKRIFLCRFLFKNKEKQISTTPTKFDLTCVRCLASAIICLSNTVTSPRNRNNKIMDYMGIIISIKLG